LTVGGYGDASAGEPHNLAARRGRSQCGVRFFAADDADHAMKISHPEHR
jgi:hypothetical protein